MDGEHKRRLLRRLEALRRAVEEEDIPEGILRSIYEELHAIDRLFPPGVKTHSIMELEGLGADYWRSIDVEEYLRVERESWERPEGWPDRR
jgi:hypothetical protein